MHHGVVLFRVKGLTHGVHRFNTQLFEALFELVEHHFKALAVGRLLVAILGKAALEVIVNAQQRLDRVDLRISVKAFLFLRSALAVVVVLGSHAQQLILGLCSVLFRCIQLCLNGFHLPGLLVEPAAVLLLVLFGSGSLGSSPPCYVSPDIFVRKVNGEFVILMNDEDLPHLQLSPLSEELAEKNRSSEEKDYMNDRLRSAVWIIRSLEERQRTLYQVMESIVKHQHDFFEYGVYKLKPLVLKDIAEDIGRSESSISRITTNKYVGTPHGIFELKYFFNSALSSSDGSQVGSESVKARIRALIDGEDQSHPLSDEDISSRLNEGLGVKTARRTVARTVIDVPTGAAAQ